MRQQLINRGYKFVERFYYSENLSIAAGGLFAGGRTMPWNTTQVFNNGIVIGMLETAYVGLGYDLAASPGQFALAPGRAQITNLNLGSEKTMIWLTNAAFQNDSFNFPLNTWVFDIGIPMTKLSANPLVNWSMWPGTGIAAASLNNYVFEVAIGIDLYQFESLPLTS